MRLDRITPGMWITLLALMCSVALYVAALAGWGRGLPRDSDSIDLPVLPQLPEGIVASMPALAEGSAVLQRPLFHPSRLPQRYLTRSADDSGGVQQSLRLTGVIITPTSSLATLSGEGGLSVRLRLGGEPVQGWQLLDLSPRQATVSGPQGIQTLLLAVHEASAADEVPSPVAISTGPSPGAASGGGARQAVPVATDKEKASGHPAGSATAKTAASVPVSANDTPEPSASQIQAIRERIQARRRQMQQASGQNTDGNP